MNKEERKVFWKKFAAQAQRAINAMMALVVAFSIILGMFLTICVSMAYGNDNPGLVLIIAFQFLGAMFFGYLYFKTFENKKEKNSKSE